MFREMLSLLAVIFVYLAITQWLFPKLGVPT